MIVVDNGSTDGSMAKIQEAFPQHTYVENGENLGFAAGNNAGLKKGIELGADLLLLLNNDTEVAPGFLDKIVQAAGTYPEAGVFGPKIYFYDDPATIWYAGGSVDPKTGRCYHVGCGDSSGHDEIKETDYVCGCALAIRREVFEEVGGMAPEFFLIWEEIDWCYRIRAAGYKCLFVPAAKVWHKVSSSFEGGNRGPMWQYYYFRNRLLFHRRHGTKKGLLRAEFLDLLKTSFHPKTPPETKARYRAALLGICDFYLGKFGKGRLARFTQ